MIYKVTIDSSLCSGFGSCVQQASETFRLDGATATAEATTADPRVLAAAASCPMGAITVEAAA
ncbi:MAG TPA: ferredoxin [Gaiellaceae bacterium]|jgi:ferredoxin|nr:ferredoxin [Gaiellaceae bacterium]